MPGVQVLKRADQRAHEDPLQETPEVEVGSRSGDQDSVVGIQILRLEMYTGTLIKDLMTMVERSEWSAQQKRVADERELQRIFELQTPPMHSERVYAGAA